MLTALLDGNIYDKLADDEATRELAAALTERRELRVIATPVVERVTAPQPKLPEICNGTGKKLGWKPFRSTSTVAITWINS